VELELAELIRAERVLFDIRSGLAVTQIDGDHLKDGLPDAESLTSPHREFPRVHFLEVNGVPGGFQPAHLELCSVALDFAVLARDQKIPRNGPATSGCAPDANDFSFRNLSAPLLRWLRTCNKQFHHVARTLPVI